MSEQCTHQCNDGCGCIITILLLILVLHFCC